VKPSRTPALRRSEHAILPLLLILHLNADLPRLHDSVVVPQTGRAILLRRIIIPPFLGLSASIRGFAVVVGENAAAKLRTWRLQRRLRFDVPRCACLGTTEAAGETVATAHAEFVLMFCDSGAEGAVLQVIQKSVERGYGGGDDGKIHDEPVLVKSGGLERAE
jgi:hypothetical protein